MWKAGISLETSSYQDEENFSNTNSQDEKAEPEVSFLSGVLGFGLSISNAIAVALYAAFLSTNNLIQSGISATYFVLFAALLFWVALASTNQIQKPLGRRMLITLYYVSILACVLCTYFDLLLLTLAFTVVQLVSTIVLYAGFLVKMKRSLLMLVTEITFVVMGILVVAQTQVAGGGFIIAQLCISCIAAFFTALFIYKDSPYGDFISKADSKERNVELREHTLTLLLIGFLLGAIAVVFYDDLAAETAVILIGASVVTASLMSIVFRSFGEQIYFESVRKGFALVAILLPVSVLLDGYLKLAVLGIYIFFMTLQTIIVIDAVIECARFNMISPCWFVGRQSTMLSLGTALGIFLIVLGNIFQGMHAQAMVLMCLAIAFISAFVQIFVNHLLYPFGSIDELKSDKAKQAPAQNGKKKAIWRQKLEIAYEKYRLSPREREVLQILMHGRDTKYIMDKFYVSQSTAKTHIYNIYRKFDVHSRQDLIDLVESIEVELDDDGMPLALSQDEDKKK